ncbi:MAG: putative membrane protein [Dokdonia sp.]|jgi:hypothetical membrane protein
MIISNNHKYVRTAVLFLSIGWLYFWMISYLHYVAYSNNFNEFSRLLSLPKLTIYQKSIFEVVIIILGLLSLYFSIRTKTTKSWQKALLIILSLALLLFSLADFPYIYFNIDTFFWE